MELKARINEDMKTAMKEKNAEKLGVVRMLLAEIKKREIDSRTAEDKDTGMNTEGVEKVIKSMIKSRQDSIEAFLKGGRQDLVDKEKKEVELLSVYLPKQMDAAEVEKLVVAAIQETGASGPNDIGKVMKAALAKAGGKADGKLVNELARTKLSS